MTARGPSEWSRSAAEIVGRVTDRWVLAGALAADRYRLAPRGTTDVDLISEWSEDLVVAFEAAGYDVRRVEDPDVGHPHLLICRKGEERVDILIPTVDYQEVALDRGRREHVLTIEDVLVHKLIAWRARDRDDIVSILAAGHPFDRGYVEHWAREWDVLARWKEASGG